MDTGIRSDRSGVVRSGEHSRSRKPRVLKAYGKEYEIPVRTAELSEKWISVIKAIANTSEISDTVREIKNGIALFIGGEEAERIFPDENSDRTDIDELLGFWFALNYEWRCCQKELLEEYQPSEVIRR